MKNILFILFCVLVLQACETNDENSNAVVGSIFSISVVDAQGNDLLDPNSPNFYSKDSIRIYTVDGELVNYPIYHDYLDVNDIKAYVYDIGNFCNDEELNNGYCKRYWHWNSTEVDTIEIFVKPLNENVYNSYKYKINGTEYLLTDWSSFTIQIVK